MTLFRFFSPALVLLLSSFSIVSAQDATPRRTTPSTPRPAHEHAAVAGEDAEISAAVQRYIDALESRDTAYIRAASLPQTTTVARAVPALPGQLAVVRTLDENIAQLARGTRRFEGRVWSPRISVDGGIAVFIAPYDAWYDGAFSHCGIDNCILVHSGDRWLVSHLIYTVQREGCAPSPLGPPR